MRLLVCVVMGKFFTMTGKVTEVGNVCLKASLRFDIEVFKEPRNPVIIGSILNLTYDMMQIP